MDPDGAPMLSDSPYGEKPAQVNGREHLLGHEETRENADAVPDEDSASGRRGPSSGLRAASQSSEMRTGKGPSDWATRESSVASRQRTRGDAEERDCLVAWRPRAGGRAWDPGLRRREAASDRSLSGWEAERKHAGCQRGMRAQTATSSNGFRVSEQREAGLLAGREMGAHIACIAVSLSLNAAPASRWALRTHDDHPKLRPATGHFLVVWETDHHLSL